MPYHRTAVVMDWIAAGQGDGTHARRLKQVGAVELLVLDDFGLTLLSETQQTDLYEMICERYKKRSTILISNRDFNEWSMVFANPLMGSAAMDRLVHRAVKIVIRGKNYQVDSFVRRCKQQSDPTSISSTNRRENFLGKTMAFWKKVANVYRHDYSISIAILLHFMIKSIC